MASRRSTRLRHARLELSCPTPGTEQFAQAAASLQDTLPLEQQIAYVLEAARETVGVERLAVWALAPEADRLIHVASSGMSETDRLSLDGHTEIPLAGAGAMTSAYRAKGVRCGRR